MAPFFPYGGPVVPGGNNDLKSQLAPSLLSLLQARQAAQSEQDVQVPPAQQTPANNNAEPAPLRDPDVVAGPSAVIDQIADAYPEQTPMDLAKQIAPDKETTVTQHKQTKKEIAAEGDIEATFDKQAENERQKGTNNVAKAISLNDQAERELELQREIDKKRAEKQAYADRKLAEADAYLAEKRRNYEENGTVRDFFGGDASKRINAALLTGIGAFASARGSGMPNLIGNAIAQEMDIWHKQEMERIKRDKDLLDLAKGEREHALAAADTELKNREAAMLDVATKERAKILASYGIPEAQIAADRGIIDLQQKKAEKIQEIESGLRTTVTSKTTNQTQQEAEKAAVAAAIKKGELGKPEQGTLEKVGEFNNYLSQMDKTLKLAKERPDLLAHVMKARQQWKDVESTEGLPFVGKATAGITRMIGQAPVTEEDAISGKYGPWFGAKHTKTLSTEDAEKARELFKGIKNIEVGKGMTFGGVLRDSDVSLAQQISGTIYGTPQEQLKAIEDFRKDISQRRDLLTNNKDIKQTGREPASSNAGKMTDDKYRKGVAVLEKMESEGKRGTPEWKRMVSALRAASAELRGE